MLLLPMPGICTVCTVYIIPTHLELLFYFSVECTLESRRCYSVYSEVPNPNLFFRLVASDAFTLYCVRYKVIKIEHKRTYCIATCAWGPCLSCPQHMVFLQGSFYSRCSTKKLQSGQLKKTEETYIFTKGSKINRLIAVLKRPAKDTTVQN
jgi:hypothetical protein